jgi:hypothetical protein
LFLCRQAAKIRSKISPFRGTNRGQNGKRELSDMKLDTLIGYLRSLNGVVHSLGLTLLTSLPLCSCATKTREDSRLPATVSMNKDAGREGLLMVVVRLADGEKLPLAMDTGSPVTAFDKSLEPRLGKRLDTGTLKNFGVEQNVGVYAAPKLYLGNVPLRTTGSNVATFDRQKLADHGWPSFMGFLGMDVLQNYCIQLDFAAGQIRFLDHAHADKSKWGKPFPLTDIGDGCLSMNDNLAGVKGPVSMIDTGCDCSGWLQPALFQQWTNQEASADGKIHSPNGTLGGKLYRDLDLRPLNAISLTNDDGHLKFNGIGLRVLAENLVTFDFPHQMMYLKHTSDWPLFTSDKEMAMKLAEKSVMETMVQLLKRGRLPGVSQGEHGKTTTFHLNRASSPYLDTATVETLKNGESALYHYTFTRTAKNGPWKLQKAWRTDQNGHTMEEYPLP